MKKAKKYFNIILPLVILNLVIFTPILAQSQGLVGCDGPNCGINDFFRMIDNVIKELLKIGIAFIAIVISYAGWTYMTANGDSGKIKQANGMFTKAAIGFVIALSAFLIVKLLVSLTGAEGGLMIELRG